jgi:putative tributyrin esterase
MNAATIRAFAPSLNREIEYTALLPTAAPPQEPHVLLLLHGMQGNQTSWLTRTSLCRWGDAHNFLIILPGGENSWWLDWGPGQRHESFLMNDLYAHVGRTFRVQPGPWAIGGLSMGGFGAMRLAFSYPERFRSVWSHSGWFGPAADCPALEFGPYPGDPADLDVVRLADRSVASTRRPAIGFDCGLADPFLADNRRLAGALTERGIAHEYSEHPGGHDWNYWDEQIKAQLAFHTAALS